MRHEAAAEQKRYPSYGVEGAKHVEVGADVDEADDAEEGEPQAHDGAEGAADG